MQITSIENMKKRIKRADSYMPSLMKQAVVDGKLSGEFALSIFNTYGITLDVILLIAHSHGIDVNEKEFEFLLEKQKEKHRNMKQC